MTAGTHWLFQTGLYKRNQGRITRQVTFAALLATVAIGCWRLSEIADRLRPSGSNTAFRW